MDHEPELFRCKVCGEENGNKAYFVGKLCYACHLDTYIPKSYKRREKYVHIASLGHANATKHPPLGVSFLDQTRTTIGEIALNSKQRPRW